VCRVYQSEVVPAEHENAEDHERSGIRLWMSFKDTLEEVLYHQRFLKRCTHSNKVQLLIDGPISVNLGRDSIEGNGVTTVYLDYFVVSQSTK
jgi:hypothetical protein